MDSILKETVLQMKKELDDMTLSNIVSKKKSFKQYNKILTALSELHESKGDSFTIKKESSVVYPEKEEELIMENLETIEPNQIATKDETDYSFEVEVEEVTEVDESEEPKEDIDELASIFDGEKELIGYPFERKLTGGFLIKGTPSENIFVPESIIRELDIQEGDLVSAEIKEGSRNNHRNYYYRIIEKNDKPIDTKRIEFKYGVVEFDVTSSRFVVSEDINKESLRLEGGEIMTYIITDREASQFSLVHGDIVDISWYEGSFEKAKVIWKHFIEDIPSKETESERIMNHKKENGNNKKSTSEDSIEKTLEEKKIVLVGLEPFWDKYKKLVEERGGTFEGVESGRHKTSMSAAIRKADLVVVGISYTSHDASIYANARCKHYSVPFTSISGFGGTSFINEVETQLLSTN